MAVVYMVFDGRRWMLPTFSRLAHSAMYDAMDSDAAGNARMPCLSHHVQNSRQSARYPRSVFSALLYRANSRACSSEGGTMSAPLPPWTGPITSILDSLIPGPAIAPPPDASMPERIAHTEAYRTNARSRIPGCTHVKRGPKFGYQLFARIAATVRVRSRLRALGIGFER
jgi:hypothetical protein